MKIMVVDDEKDITELVKALLDKKGFEVVCSNHPEEVQLSVIKEEPDVLLLDMRMPNVSGLDVYEKVISSVKNNKLKVIFFSATGDFNHKILKKKGVIGFIQKPFEINYFLKCIEKYLEK